MRMMMMMMIMNGLDLCDVQVVQEPEVRVRALRELFGTVDSAQ